MPWTTSQQQAVRTAVLADGAAAAFKAAGDAFSLKAWLNEQPASGGVSVWRTEALVNDIFDAIDYSRFTPNGALDDATLLDALAASRRQAQLLAIQTKQINLQIMLFGQRTVNASKPNIRAALRDAVINLPAGNGGASVSAGGAGGVTVLNACTRIARRVEAMLVGADATTGPVTAKLLGFEGLADDELVNWLIAS